MTYNARTYWEERAKRHGPTYVGYLGNPKATQDNFERFAPLIEDLLPPSPEDVLDFGCGSGRFTALLSERCGTYTGADISKTGLGYAGEAPANAQFVLLEGDALPFEDATFDLIVATFVIQHISEWDWTNIWAPELSRVLKPGGVAVIADDTEGSAAHMFPRTPDRVAAAMSLQVETTVQFVGHHWVGRLVKADVSAQADEAVAEGLTAAEEEEWTGEGVVADDEVEKGVTADELFEEQMDATPGITPEEDDAVGRTPPEEEG